MKYKRSWLVIVSLLLIVSAIGLFPMKTYAAGKKPVYVYYDMDSWKRYYVYTPIECSHRDIGYKYVEANKHSIYCRECGVIFQYEDCCFDNDCATSDYNYNRCLICLHKIPYVYRSKTVDYSNRVYID